MDNIYSIFGRTVRVISEDRVVSSVLEKELSLYLGAKDEKVDLTIGQVRDLGKIEPLSTNPSLHKVVKNGFVAALRPLQCEFIFDKGRVVKVRFSILPAGKILTFLRKWMNIQYTSHKEGIGQWLHEHILAPLTILDDKLSTIHASAVETKKGKTLVFGGTGGVGKTSLEMILCQEHSCSFVSDDICAIDAQGLVYPNLAYPKVYAYNISGNPEIRKSIFKERGLADRLQFKLHEFRGKNYARRRISPQEFYRGAVNSPKPLTAFFILFRDQSETITFEKIDSNKAASLNSRVIAREFGTFFDHLMWNEYNLTGLNENLVFDSNTLIQGANEVMTKGLSVSNNSWIVRIPHKIEHVDYKEQMVAHLKELGFLD
ncbi:MAG: hypothetical protein ABJG41_07155 [Cyclobacteriaceae bacterium]